MKALRKMTCEIGTISVSSSMASSRRSVLTWMRVVVGHHHDACAARTLRLPEVHHRRKIQIGVDDFVAAAAEVEARSHRRLAGGDVLQAGD